jgi:hypothetical protein
MNQDEQGSERLRCEQNDGEFVTEFGDNERRTKEKQKVRYCPRVEKEVRNGRMQSQQENDRVSAFRSHSVAFAIVFWKSTNLCTVVCSPDVYFLVLSFSSFRFAFSSS